MKPRAAVSTGVDISRLNDVCPCFPGVSRTLKSLVIAAKISIVLIAGLTLNRFAWCTTVVAMRLPTGVILGIDSLQTKRESGSAVLRTTTCKLNANTSVATASAGLSALGDFDLHTLLRNVAIAQSEINSSEVAIVDGIKKALREELPKAVALDFSAYITAGEPIITVFVAAYAKNPILKYISFNISSTKDVTHTTTTVDEYGRIIRFERADAITRAIPQRIKTTEAVPLVRNLLKVGVESDPEESGFPVSIVRVGKAGVQWIEKGPCP